MNLDQAAAAAAARCAAADQARAEQRAILARARAQGRTMLTPAETERFQQLRRAVQPGQRRLLTAARDGLHAMQEDERQYQARASEVYPVEHRAPREAYDRAARIGYEPRAYNPGNDPNGRSFLTDVARNFLTRDPQATERLARHMREEEVERAGWQMRAAGDATTGSFAGLTVPQYLTDLYAPATAALRPLAENCNRHPLPPQGMSLDISRITTSTSAALQANELDPVSSTSIDDTLLTIPVQTAAGQQKVSRQALDRGTGIEDVTMQDLFDRVATVLDSTLINQAVTGISAAAQNVTYTSASPTAAEFWPYIFQGHSKLEATLMSRAPVDLVVMHPRRWNWLCSLVSSSWPFMGGVLADVDAQQGGIQLTTEYGPSVRGVLSNGDKVCVDFSVPTTTGGTQDEVYVCSSRELHLWEDANSPVYLRAEQPAAGQLGVLLVAFEYFAFSCQRYQPNPAKITGTGLAQPAGF
jgi:HK97 family phage major capsid protein